MKNGSQSPTPKKAGRKLEIQMTFPDVVSAIMGGKRVRRTEWVDEEEYCLLRDNFLMIHRNGKFHTWIVSEGDMLAKDWVIKP